MSNNAERSLEKTLVKKCSNGNSQGLIPARHPPMQGAEKQHPKQDVVQAVKEGSLKVVKIPASMSSRLKREVCDSFVGTGARPGVTTNEIGEWLPQTLRGCGSEAIKSIFVLGEALVSCVALLFSN